MDEIERKGIALERALDFIEMLTEDPLLTSDDIAMTLSDVQEVARIELTSIRAGLDGRGHRSVSDAS